MSQDRLRVAQANGVSQEAHRLWRGQLIDRLDVFIGQGHVGGQGRRRECLGRWEPLRRPARDGLGEAFHGDGLRQVVIHPGLEVPLAVADERVRGERDDRHVRRVTGQAADLADRRAPVELGHLPVHEDQIVAVRARRIYGRSPIANERDPVTQSGEHLANHPLVYRMVLGDEQVRARSKIDARRGWIRRWGQGQNSSGREQLAQPPLQARWPHRQGQPRVDRQRDRIYFAREGPGGRRHGDHERSNRRASKSSPQQDERFGGRTRADNDQACR